MATKDRTALKDEFKNGNLATGERFADLIDSMKVVQLPVVDPQALGTSLSFIDSISQDADGKITVTKKTLDLANAHELNPFKGWYKTGDTLPTDGFDGAYLYFKDTTQSPVVTTIYQWNGTAYADTGTEVDESNVNTFATGQAVNDVGIDDEPIAGSNNLVKSEGIAFEHALQNIVVAKCAIISTTWVSGSDKTHIVIPVNGGERVEWSGYSVLYYAVLTSYPTFPKNGDIPAFLNGYTSRQTASSPFNIPSGCKFLIINTPSGYTDIIINGKSIIGGLWTALLQKINQYGIEDGAVTLAKLANDIVGDGLEHINYKKEEIVRDTLANSKADYINKRAIYEKTLNVDGALDVNGFKNLFVPKYRKANQGTIPTADDPTGSGYDSTLPITVQQGHKYMYQLYAVSSSVYLIAEYDSNDSLITATSIKGNSTTPLKKGIYTPSTNCVKVGLCNNGTSFDSPAFIDITNNVFAFNDYVNSIKQELNEDIEDLQNNTISDNDLSYVIVSKNIANPANIFDGGIGSTGNLNDGTGLPGWKAIAIPVTEGQVLSFGGFYLGRQGYAQFYNGNTKVGNVIQYNDPNGSVLDSTQNITVPQNATVFYIDIQTSQSTTPEGDNTPYDKLMVNIGASILPYDSFEKKISEINGIEISGADETLEPRVDALEDTVSQQGDVIITLNSRVDILENTDIVEDLPISDGTDISVGYAYIDSTSGIVKVKMS